LHRRRVGVVRRDAPAARSEGCQGPGIHRQGPQPPHGRFLRNSHPWDSFFSSAGELLGPDGTSLPVPVVSGPGPGNWTVGGVPHTAGPPGRVRCGPAPKFTADSAGAGAGWTTGAVGTTCDSG